MTVDGAITAGVLNVAALSSAGALIAPYFTATSTTATSTFMGSVGIGTTMPSSKLTIVGDIDISAGSAYKYNGATIATASTTLNNYFFGGAGNLTMTGVNNIASGYLALYSNTTGGGNVANGVQSLNANTTGIFNVGNGRGSLSSNTTGSYNTANGSFSLYSNTTGSYNTALGFQTGYEINTATSTGANTIIGYNTGRGIVTGINNTVLGANVTGLSSTLSNNIIIADGAGNQRINVGSTGNVGIGTTTPSSKLTVTQSADTATGGFWLSTADNTDFRSQYMSTSGVLSFYGGDTAGTLNTATLNAAGEWTNASDISYKENIENLSNGLDIALALKPRTYDIKNTDNHRIGFIAQEVEGVVPEVVGGVEGSKGISYGNLVAVAISAIQELAEKISGFASIFKSDRIETKTLCVGGTCLTESELLDLISNSNQKPSSSSSDSEPKFKELPIEIPVEQTKEQVFETDIKDEKQVEEEVNAETEEAMSQTDVETPVTESDIAPST